MSKSLLLIGCRPLGHLDNAVLLRSKEIYSEGQKINLCCRVNSDGYVMAATFLRVHPGPSIKINLVLNGSQLGFRSDL